jgi:hypothetical protein
VCPRTQSQHSCSTLGEAATSTTRQPAVNRAVIGDTIEQHTRAWVFLEHAGASADVTAEEIEYTVLSTQKNDTAAVATVEGFCEKDRVSFQATLENAHDPNVSLGFITSRFDYVGIIGQNRH